MPVTREEINELAELRARIYQHAENELEELWKHYTPEVVAERFRDFLLQEVPPLINSHADAAGTAVADWYEAIREKDVLDKHRYFRAIMGDYPDPQAVNGAIRASARGLFTGKPEQTRQQLATAVRRYIRFTENDTFRKTVLADSAKPRYALVPSLPMTCSWCIMLASRGFVYPEDTAQMMTIHDHCNCTFVPVFKKKELKDAFIDGYDPERYKEMWKKSKQEAARRNRRGKGEHVKQLTVMRELYAGELTDGKWEQLKGKFPGTDITRSQWAKRRQEAAKLAKAHARELQLSRNTSNFLLLPPEPKPLPFKWNSEEHFILTDTAWNHILYGDHQSGGHTAGYSWRVTNLSSRRKAAPQTKTVFPPDWSERDIATAIRAVIAENKGYVEPHSRVVIGNYKGVKIKVSLNKPVSDTTAKISTAHPID